MTAKMAERFSRDRVLDLLFDSDFDLSDGDSSDEDSGEGPSYLGNDELHPLELDALAGALTSTEFACSESNCSETESTAEDDEEFILAVTSEDEDGGKNLLKSYKRA